MQLVRLGRPGGERPAVRVGGQDHVDVSDVVDDFDEAFFAAGGADLLRDVVANRSASGDTFSGGSERIGAPIGRPHQIVGI